MNTEYRTTEDLDRFIKAETRESAISLRELRRQIDALTHDNVAWEIIPEADVPSESWKALKLARRAMQKAERQRTADLSEPQEKNHEYGLTNRP